MRTVEAAASAALVRLASPHLMSADDYFADAEHARTLFARLINADDPNGVALVPSVSYGVALAAKNVPIRSGDNGVLWPRPAQGLRWRRSDASTI